MWWDGCDDVIDGGIVAERCANVAPGEAQIRVKDGDNGAVLGVSAADLALSLVAHSRYIVF